MGWWQISHNKSSPTVTNPNNTIVLNPNWWWLTVCRRLIAAIPYIYIYIYIYRGATRGDIWTARHPFLQYLSNKKRTKNNGPFYD